jgi:hypothetical protein
VEDGLPVPFQLQVLEPDHLDNGKTEDMADGGYILQGIEFDALGRRRAYWLFPVHPGETRGRSLASRPVPARQVLHLFERLRPGQVRGVPWFAPVILKLRDLDDYDDAELMRKKIEACFAAFVTGAQDEETYRVETYGKVVGITRQVLINDDLDAFTRVPSLFGTAAATLESDVVWSIFTANLAMADGKTLFHAGHSNLAGTGTALDVANLAKARTAMSRQTGLDGKTVLNIRPTFLVVPTSLELAAEQLLAQNIVPTRVGDVVPATMRSLMVVSEPRLDPASGAVPWYLVASPTAIDTCPASALLRQTG